MSQATPPRHPITEWALATARMLDKDATVREIQATSTLVVEIMPSSVSQAGRLVGRGGEVSEAIRRIARSMGQSARLDVLVSVARIDLPSLTPEHTP